METYFATMFEGVGHDRLLIILIPLAHPHTLEPINFTDHEINIIKNPALEELHRQRILKENIAVSILD